MSVAYAAPGRAFKRAQQLHAENDRLRKTVAHHAALLNELRAPLRQAGRHDLAEHVAVSLAAFGKAASTPASPQERLVLAGLEMLATQRALTWAERCAHADLARRVDAVR